MARDQAEVDLPVGRGELFLGKYLIGELLGAGGMGVVVAAEHVQLGQKVAVKFLPATLRENPMAVARFAREARAAAQIRSEHVVRVVDVSGPDSDICYMVMEYLEGSDLAHVLHTRGALPPGEVVGYVLQACEAIAEAHGAGIVHRDLKPSNLFLTRRRDGSPLIKVLDFGISKVVAGGDGHSPDLTSTMTLMGSPMYMSPEQVRSTKNVDSRTDLWSLGVILHELVTGQPVYQADSAMGLLAMIAADPPTPIRQVRPDLPAALEATILACLEKQPAARLPDVGALARRLKPLAPRWAAVAVERIMAASLPAVATDTGPTHRQGSSGATLPLPPSGSTTSAQLSGELLPVAGPGRTLAEPSPSVSTTEEAADGALRSGWRSRGRLVAVALGAAAAIAVVAAMVGQTSRDPSAARVVDGPRPTAQAGAAVRAVEKQDPAPAPEARVAVPVPPAPAAGTPPSTLEAPGVAPPGPGPEQAAAVERPVPAATSAHAEEAIRVRPPKHPEGAPTSRVHKQVAGAAPPETTGPAAAPRTPKPPSNRPSSADPAAGKDPLDGRR